MAQLQDVTVQRISLLTDEHQPAVPKAESRFALFKSVPQRVLKLKKHFWLDAEDRYEDDDLEKSGVPRVMSPNTVSRVQEIQRQLEKNAQALQ